MFLDDEPLQVFTSEQFKSLSSLWIEAISRIALTKLEEEHWTNVYCKALGIQQTGFSNLFGKDVEYLDRVIEMKCIRMKYPFPNRIMLPALTRKVNEWSATDSAQNSMELVISGYNELIRNTFEGKTARWGLLICSPCLSHASYLEYPIRELDINALTAEYNHRPGSDSRRSTTNLWIYQDGIKIISVTSPSAGMKIQPYFNVPKSDHRYDLHLSDLGIALEDHLSFLIEYFSGKLGVTPEDLIISLSKSEKEKASDFRYSFIVDPETVKGFGGFGSPWQDELIRRLALTMRSHLNL